MCCCLASLLFRSISADTRAIVINHALHAIAVRGIAFGCRCIAWLVHHFRAASCAIALVNATLVRRILTNLHRALEWSVRTISVHVAFILRAIITVATFDIIVAGITGGHARLGGVRAAQRTAVACCVAAVGAVPIARVVRR